MVIGFATSSWRRRVAAVVASSVGLVGVADLFGLRLPLTGLPGLAAFFGASLALWGVVEFFLWTRRSSLYRRTLKGFELDPRAALVDIGLSVIEPGVFTMGSARGDPDCFADEFPQHRVTITRRLEVLSAPVTQALWESVMGAGLRPRYDRFLDARKPVTSISWYEAVEFCNRLSVELGLRAVYTVLVGQGAEPEVFARNDNSGFRLPTEAEWEYFARAGSRTRYWSGDTVEGLSATEWWGLPREQGPMPVKTKSPNPWGLFDTNGNIGEWCFDFYGPYADLESRDPEGPISGANRVFRGGRWWWSDHPNYYRSADRDALLPMNPELGVGFRIVRTVDPEVGLIRATI